MNEVFDILLEGRSLSEPQCEQVFTRLLNAELDAARIGALLALIARRGPSVDELVGAAKAMRRFVTPVVVDGISAPVIDTCGTGGAPKLFNVSTLGAIVTAAAAPGRVLVAKHGNRSRTGRGSAELLEALGVNVHATPVVQAQCLRDIGVCFSFAPNHHPAAKHAAEVRKSLGFPTIFNLLGPLANPAGATRQLVGTYSQENASKIAHALARLGAEHAMVVTSVDGLDELTTTDDNITYTIRSGEVVSTRVDARQLGFVRTTIDALRVATLAEAVDVARDVLAGNRSPRRDLVVLNAAASLAVAGVVETVAEGVPMAQHALDSGGASRTLGALASISSAET